MIVYFTEKLTYHNAVQGYPFGDIILHIENPLECPKN